MPPTEEEVAAVRKIGDVLLEGLGWGLLAGLTRTVVRYGAGASRESSDAAGLAVPMLGAALSGRSFTTAAAGSLVGVTVSEIGESIATGTARIVAWSDSHGRATPRNEIIARMAIESAVDAYVFCGDAEGWDQWYRDTEPLRRRSRVIPLPGNHDDPPSSGIGGLALPRVERIAGANIVLLGDPPTSRDVKKAVKLLDPSLLNVVFVHRSPIPFSRQNAAGTVRVREALLPLLERGVTVVCGHHHVYGWGLIGPSLVISAGIGGSKHYDCLCEPPCQECDEDVRGYLRIDIGRKVSTYLVPVTVDHERS